MLRKIKFISILVPTLALFSGCGELGKQQRFFLNIYSVTPFSTTLNEQAKTETFLGKFAFPMIGGSGSGCSEAVLLPDVRISRLDGADTQVLDLVALKPGIGKKEEAAFGLPPTIEELKASAIKQLADAQLPPVAILAAGSGKTDIFKLVDRDKLDYVILISENSTQREKDSAALIQQLGKSNVKVLATTSADFVATLEKTQIGICEKTKLNQKANVGVVVLGEEKSTSSISANVLQNANVDVVVAPSGINSQNPKVSEAVTSKNDPKLQAPKPEPSSQVGSLSPSAAQQIDKNKLKQSPPEVATRATTSPQNVNTVRPDSVIRDCMPGQSGCDTMPTSRLK